MDCSDSSAVNSLNPGRKAVLAVHDPPYNFVAFRETDVEGFIELEQTLD